MSNLHEILHTINVWLLAFTLVALAVGIWFFRFFVRFPLIGSWFVWMGVFWSAVMVYDQLGVYYGWGQEPLFATVRTTLVRVAILWSVCHCFFRGWWRLNQMSKDNGGNTQRPEQ